MPEKYLPSEKYNEKQLPSKSTPTQQIPPQNYKERIKYYTSIGGLDEIPNGYDEKDGDWKHILSDNPFEVLYLDYKQIDKINEKIIQKNYNTLKKFWSKKQELYRTGIVATRDQLKKRYGENTLENALRFLDNAYNKLSSNIKETYKEVDRKRFENAKEYLKRFLSIALADGILTDEEEREIFNQAKLNTELSDNEIKKIIDDYIVETNSVRAGTSVTFTQDEKEIQTILKFKIKENQMYLKENDEDFIFEQYKDKITYEKFNEIILKVLKELGDVEREKTIETDKKKFKELYFSLLSKYGLNPDDSTSPEFVAELIKKLHELNIYLKNETKNSIKNETINEYKTMLLNEKLKFEDEAYEKLKHRKKSEENIKILLNSQTYKLLLPHMRQEIIEEVINKIKDEQRQNFENDLIKYAQNSHWKITDKDKSEFIKIAQKYDWLDHEYINSIINETLDTIKAEYQKEKEKFQSLVEQKLASYKFALPVNVQSQLENDPQYHLDIIDRREIIMKLEKTIRINACSEFEKFAKNFIANETIIPTIEEYLIELGDNTFNLSKSKNNISFKVKTSEEIINSIRRPFQEVAEEKINQLALSKKINDKLKNKYKLQYSSYVSKNDFNLLAESFIPKYLSSTDIPTDIPQRSKQRLLQHLNQLCEKYNICIVDQPKIDEFKNILNQSITENSKNFKLELNHWLTDSFISEIKQIASIHGIPENETNKIINDITQNYTQWTKPNWKKFILSTFIISLLFAFIRLLMSLIDGKNIYIIHPEMLKPIPTSQYIATTEAFKVFDHEDLVTAILYISAFISLIIGVIVYKKWLKKNKDEPLGKKILIGIEKILIGMAY